MRHGSGVSRRGASLKEPRTGKSFRAAGVRIVRQESAAPSVVTRLLGAPAQAVREIRSDDDAWAVRLAALATLSQYDGLAFVVGEPLHLSHAYNVAGDPLADPAIRAAVDDIGRNSATARIPAAVQLADGRAADVLLVAPLVVSETCVGVVIAFRVGRSFAAADAVNAYGVAELLAVELATGLGVRRDDADRRQALALYELGRLALFGEDDEAALQDAVTILANGIDHDAARLWISRPDGSLELRAGHPQDAAPLRMVRARDHGVLSEALVQRRVVSVDDATPEPWMPSDARSLIVVPLIDRARPLGVLVLGRGRGPYGAEDVEFAGVIGSFIARLVSVVTRPDTRERPQRSRTPVPHPITEWQDERELLEELTSRGN